MVAICFPDIPATGPFWAGPGETDERYTVQAQVGCAVCCVVPAVDISPSMSIVSIVALGMAMSTDAFAAALAKGACMSRPRLAQALCVGITFGIVEAMTPLLGWMLGSFASHFIASIDHWVAFGLLLVLGGHMIWKSFQPVETDCCKMAGPLCEGPVGRVMAEADIACTSIARPPHVTPAGAGVAEVRSRMLPEGMLATVMTSVATSIDAMAVGVTLAFVEVPISQVALVIGLCTTVMVTIGVMLGRLLGGIVGRRAEMLGGIVLILIGSIILYEHLSEGPALALIRDCVLS